MGGQTHDDGPDMENRDPNELNSHVKVTCFILENYHQKEEKRKLQRRIKQQQQTNKRMTRTLH